MHRHHVGAGAERITAVLRFHPAVGRGRRTRSTFTAGVSDPGAGGLEWYAFNEVLGAPTGTEDTLLCFDLASDTACADQPFPLTSWRPVCLSVAFRRRTGVAARTSSRRWSGSTDELACYNTSTGGNAWGHGR